MTKAIEFGIKLRMDGREVDATLVGTRDHLRRFAGDAQSAGDSSARSFSAASRGVRSISTQLEFAKDALLTYVGAASAVRGAAWVVQQASAVAQLDARIKAASGSMAEHAVATAGVRDIANRWGAAATEAASAYARLNPVVAALGGTSETTLRLLDGLAASLRLSGATAGESSAVMMQFAQAMGSGRVSGDEFRSLMESAEPMMRAVASTLGKTTGELRQMAEAGTLTSSVFANALLPSIDAMVSRASAIPLGLTQAMQVLQNEAQRAFGTEFAAAGAEAGQALTRLAGGADAAARAVHATAFAVGELSKAGLALGAGAGAVWLTKQTRAAVDMAIAYRAAQTATADKARADVAAAHAAVAQTAATAAQAREQQLLAAQIALYGPQRAALGRAATAAMVAEKAAIDGLAAAEARLATVRREGNLAMTAGTRLMSAAGTAVAALGGPVGIVTGLLVAGGAAWALWGDRAKTSLDDVKERLEALDKRDKFGTGDLGDARAKLDRAESRLLLATQAGRSVTPEHLSSLRSEVAQWETLVRRLEAQEPGVAAAASGNVRALSAAGDWAQLTKDLVWRERLLAAHAEKLSQLAIANAERYRDAVGRGANGATLAGLAAENTAAVGALRSAQQKELEGLGAKSTELDRLREALIAKTAAQEADAASAEKLNDTQRDYAKWLRAVTEGVVKLTPAEMRRAAALWDTALAAADAADAVEAQRKANEEYVKAVEASEAAIAKDMDALRERTAAAQEELRLRGATRAGIERETIARLENQLAMVDGWDSQEGLANRLREEIALRKQYATAVAGQDAADAAGRSARDAVDHWRDASDDIRRSLTDEIMRGGKSGGELLESYFRTVVLRPAVEATGNVLLSAIGLGGGSGVGGGSSALGTASSLSSIWNTFSGTAGSMATSFGMSSVGQAIGLSAPNAAMAGVPGVFAGDTAMGASLTGAGSTLAAAAPWVMAALVAYDLLATKSTPHRGGFATYSDASGLSTGAATRGANRQLGGTGMRLDSFDAGANDASGNLARGITTLFDNLGTSFGGGAGYSVGTGFADDSSSDGAWGALRITDASGNDLINWARGQRGGGPAFADGSAGQAQYQQAVADSVMTALRDIDLPAWADNMLDALGSAPSLDKIVETADLITQLRPVAGQLMELGVAAEHITPAAIAAAGGIDNLTATLAALPNLSADANAAFEESRRASLSAASAYLESTERARQAASDWDGSLTSAQALGAAVQQRYQDELAYLQQVRDMVRSISADVAGAQQTYLLDTLDPAGKYDYYDAQMAAAMDMIRASSDPEVISRYATQYLQAQGAAWQLLSPEQQRQYLPEFTADAADVGTLVTSRGGAIESSVRSDNEAFAATVKDAVVEGIREAFAPVTTAITDAANTPVTSNVNLNVHVSQDGAITVTAEPAVGGWDIGP